MKKYHRCLNKDCFYSEDRGDYVAWDKDYHYPGDGAYITCPACGGAGSPDRRRLIPYNRADRKIKEEDFIN